MKAEAEAGKNLVNQMQEDAVHSGVNSVQATPAVDPTNPGSAENKEVKEAEIDTYIKMAAELR